jgi:L-arabinonolactonase
VEITKVPGVSLRWGESVRWDDRRRRLYFVDCATHELHWMERAEPPLRSLKMPSIPTGVVLADDDRLVVALADGLHVVDPDEGKVELLTPYPEGLGGRANDANADLDGNLVTGTLNLGPGPGSYWWFSATEGWRRLDDGIANANGPVVLDVEGRPTLVFADTHASVIYAYDYDGGAGSVGERRVFARTAELGGMPDGACADADGGVWSCLFGAGKIVRFTADGADDMVATGAELTSDVTFGGPDLDRMYFVSLNLEGDASESSNAGALMAVEGSGRRGRPEPRFSL